MPPPGYVGYEEGGQLTEKIRRRPYAVVLLDEIEKAHPDVFSILLQIMEEGRLTDSYGHNVDFKNTIVIMTTNIGAEAIKDQTAFGFTKRNEDVTYDKMKEMVDERIGKEFRPEFLNRVSDVIVFRGLTRANLEDIIDLELAKVRERLDERNIQLDLSEEAREFIIERGYNPDFGAPSAPPGDREPHRRAAFRGDAQRRLQRERHHPRDRRVERGGRGRQEAVFHHNGHSATRTRKASGGSKGRKRQRREAQRRARRDVGATDNQRLQCERRTNVRRFYAQASLCDR